MKFGTVGVLNAGIDVFAFNMLISLTGLDRGIWIAMFKSLRSSLPFSTVTG